MNKGYKFNFLPASLIESINRGICNRQKYVTHVKSKYIISILNSFIKGGFISNFCIKNNIVLIKLKYDYFGNSAINHIYLCSKPSKTIYMDFYFLQKQVHNNPTVEYFLTTNTGVLSGKDALKKNLGGKLVCYISY